LDSLRLLQAFGATISSLVDGEAPRTSACGSQLSAARDSDAVSVTPSGFARSAATMIGQRWIIMQRGARPCANRPRTSVLGADSRRFAIGRTSAHARRAYRAAWLPNHPRADVLIDQDSPPYAGVRHAEEPYPHASVRRVGTRPDTRSPVSSMCDAGVWFALAPRHTSLNANASWFGLY